VSHLRILITLPAVNASKRQMQAVGANPVPPGKDSYRIQPAFLEQRKLLCEVASNHGVDLRTAALQFSAAPDVAAALVSGASSEQQTSCELYLHADQDSC
jgi:aryl-alcohol dehydrogenase-like predicted oxidoreductase